MVVRQASTKSDLLDTLNVLKSLPVTVTLLQDVPVGKLVNSVRKASCDDAVKSVAKKLLKAWMKLTGAALLPLGAVKRLCHLE